MGEEEMDASAIIPAYKEVEWLPGTLDSLRGQDAEVIVVASGEETNEVAKDHQTTDKVLRDEKEEGWGAAVNQGVEEASGEIVLITDADTLVPEDWVESHLKHFLDEEVVGVGGTAEAREEGLHRYTADFYALYILPVLWKTGFKLMIGNNCSYRKKPLQEAGGFSEEMNLLEDVEVAYRMEKKGKVVFDRDIRTKASIRRIQEKGNLSILKTYLKGYWRYFY